MTGRGRHDRPGPSRAAGVAAPSDHRFRRPQWPLERRRRTQRIIRRLVRLGLPSLAAAALLVWGGAALIGADALRVRTIVVRGADRLSEADVLALVPGLKGEGILRVDLEAYSRRVRESPWVDEVSMFRVLPATVDIRIVERSPMALARIDHKLYLVDGAGVIIGEYGPGYSDIDLPIVDGLVTASEGSGPLVDPERVSLASAVLGALGEEPLLARRLSQVDVSNPLDAMVMFDDEPVWLHLGDRDFTGRVRRYLELRESLRDRFEGLTYVDLRADGRVFVHGQAVSTRGEP
jgi:cell division protein FtsQ